jgi:two-component system chemotaxis sensor kinase CheA
VPDIPFILCTSLEAEKDKRRGIEVGANAYIVKGSFDQSNLLETIERLL